MTVIHNKTFNVLLKLIKIPYRFFILGGLTANWRLPSPHRPHQKDLLRPHDRTSKSNLELDLGLVRGFLTSAQVCFGRQFGPGHQDGKTPRAWNLCEQAQYSSKSVWSRLGAEAGEEKRGTETSQGHPGFSRAKSQQEKVGLSCVSCALQPEESQKITQHRDESSCRFCMAVFLQWSYCQRSRCQRR